MKRVQSGGFPRAAAKTVRLRELPLDVDVLSKHGKERRMTFANGLRCTYLMAGVAIGTAAFLVASSASGQPDGSRATLSPPPEMVDACKGSAAGDDCTVAFKGHTMNGICHTGPTADAPLACVPTEPFGMSVTVDGCNGRAAGDSCSLIFGDRPIDGTCSADPYLGGQLLCRPNQKP